MISEPPRWTVPGWNRFDGLRHGFFGRAGGVSEGAFRSLNCSGRVGDDAGAVAENRRRVASALGVAEVITARQVHGAAIAAVDEVDGAVEADAISTGAGSAAAGVLTADCVPLLLVAPEVRLAVAVHAGWKGTALGIARLGLAAVCARGGLPPAEVEVALGPAIGGCCYEVGADVIAALGLPETLAPGRARVDLRMLNVAQLRAAGVPPEQIHLVGPCTRCAEGELFSHRGAGGRTGRQLAAVGWV